MLFWKLKGLEGTLSQDMSTLLAYLQTWGSKLSHTKTVMATFYLINQEAKRELKVYNNDKILPFCPTPYLSRGKTRQIAHIRYHLVALSKKSSSRVTLRQLVGSKWDAGTKTLRTAALSLFYLTAEYCAPVWSRSGFTLALRPMF